MDPYFSKLPNPLFLFLLLAQAQSAYAQISEQPIAVRSFNQTNGPSQNTVNAMVQDRRGFIWIGTQMGLNRFDGYHFKSYTADDADPNGLTDSWIDCLLLDSQQRLWMGTPTGGLLRYDLERDTFTHYPEVFKKGDRHASIHALMEDRQGHLWIGGALGALRVSVAPDGSILETTPFFDGNQNRPLLNVRSFHQDEQGRVWVGDTKYLHRLSEDVGEERVTGQGQIGDLFVFDIETVAPNRIWVSTDRGLFEVRSDETSPKLRALSDLGYQGAPSFETRAVLLNEGRVWIGSSQGLMALDLGQQRFQSFVDLDQTMRSKRDIRTLMVGVHGGLWMGCEMEGLAYTPLKQQDFQFYPKQDLPQSNPPLEKLSAFWEDVKGRLWVATFGRGLFLRETDGSHTPVDLTDQRGEDLIGNYVWALSEDQEGRIWIGTYGRGLISYEPEREAVMVYRAQPDEGSLSGDKITDLKRDADGLWIASEHNGLNYFSFETERFSNWRYETGDPTTLAGPVLTKLHVAADGVVWVGSRSGLSRMDEAGQGFQRFHFDTKAQDFIIAIAPDQTQPHELLLGTTGGLVQLNTRDSSVTTLTRADGLADEVIYGVLQDAQQNLWLSTNSGLIRYNRQTQQFRVFDTSDGLQSNEFNFGAWYQTQAGNFLFGNTNGYVSFDPARIRDNLQPPIINITNPRVNNKPLRPGPGEGNLEGRLDRAPMYADLMRISYGDLGFSLDLTPIHHGAPEKNQIQYRLDPYELDWIDTTPANRRIAYTNLKGGDYRLLVRAANHHGVWSDVNHTMTIRVSDPPWLRWWAWCLYIALALGSIGFYLYIQHRIKSRLAELVRSRTKALRYKHEQLMATAKEAGAAENATIVLHEMGNHVNSLVTSMEVIRTNVQDKEITSLDRIVSLLKDQEKPGVFLDENERGAFVLPLLSQIVTKMKERSGSVKQELNDLDLNIHKVRTSLQAQHRNSSMEAGSKSLVDVVELITQVLEVESYQIHKTAIQLRQNLHELPLMRLDEGKLRKVLFYIINGILETSSGETQSLSWVSLEAEYEDNVMSIVIVNDSAVVNQNTNDSIFAQCDDTGKLSNFLFHNAANTVNEMNGRIRWEQKEGENSFTIRLPIT